MNAILFKLDDGKMVKYVYFGDKFLKPNGLLDPAVFTDKVHPNTPEGFRILGRTDLHNRPAVATARPDCECTSSRFPVACPRRSRSCHAGRS